MKHAVKGFKNLKIGLKELEPFIRDGHHLQTGRAFPSVQLRSREMLANWLLCVAVNSVTEPDRLAFTSSPEDVGGDGVIVDTRTDETWVTEHIMVPNVQKADGLDTAGRILAAVEKKRSKGDAAYATGKTLVVFVNREGGEWYPTKIARCLRQPLLFDAAWVVSLEGVLAGEYVYNVTRLDVSKGQAPAWRVCLAKDFDDWSVEVVQ
ncbi:MAG TPA: hypothetical protein VL358_02170 [Caulobacteraceae bacterium]|nr:hypothetical protein [Caulobacteraceae bacterium]